MSLPNPAPIVRLIEAFRWSKTMFATASFGIYDLLPSTVADLAARLEVNTDALERLLDGNVSLGLLERRGDTFHNLPVAETYLRNSSPDSLAGYILYSDRALYPMWGHLEEAVREGSHRWSQTFGSPGPIFDHFFRTDEAMRTFIMGMHGFGLISSPAVVRTFDLSGFRTIVDLGGATGHLTIAACELYPRMRGIVFDLDRVIPVAREIIAQSAAADRIECVAGDFFTGELPVGDLYAMGRILHDWSRPKIELLLRRILDRLPQGGGLLLAERLLAEDRTGPLGTAMQSINMLICTEGKERTKSEYTELLLTAGFRDVRTAVTGQPLDAILATK
jgi:acetylserotonin N-methyltransferase